VTHSRSRVLRAIALGAAGLLSSRASAQAGPELVTTRHEISVPGRALAYTAHAGRLPIRHNETGEVLGDIFFVHYALDPAPGASPRPLTFLWNGGPGANSTLVHLVGFGPKRIRAPDSPLDPPGCDCVLEANDGTWLGFTDLVFVDPIGTGFSRPRAKELADGFYGARADAATIAELVRLFLQRFDAWDAPLFLGGESYGTWRAAGAAKALEERGIRVAGVLLVSGGVPVGSVEREEMRVAKLLTARTAAAFWHRRLEPGLLRDLDATLAEAERWTTDVYAPALARRDSLGATKRRTVVEGLARFTGLPVDAIDAEALVVNRADFQHALLRDRGEELARFDTRLVAGAQGPPEGARAALVGSYLRDELGFETEAAYQGLEDGYRSVNDSGPVSPGARWRYDHFAPGDPGPPRLTVGDGPPGPRPSWLREALAMDPATRVYVATGHFDSLNSCALNAHLVAVLPDDLRDNFTLACYEGGHVMYADRGVRRAMRDDVARFVGEASRAWSREHRVEDPGPDRLAPEPVVEGGVVTTQHELTLGGRVLPYVARAGTLPIRDNETGEARANVFFVSYSVDPGSGGTRPVLFAWNGGPGSNAGLLHMAAMGPRRLNMGDVYATADPEDMGSVVDNEATWLDAADLVFVDPVGTGYSRPTRAEYGPEFYDPVGDVASLAEFIRVYRTRYHAWDAPLFLAGESYGSLRAASVARKLQEGGIDVSGIVFISGSPGLVPVPSTLAAPLLLPSLTATAAYHGALAPSLAGPDAVDRAQAWAMGPYADALRRLQDLGAQEREEVRQTLSAWTGLEVDAVDADSLVVSGPAFSERLLTEQGRILGRYDARLSRPRKPEEGIFDPREDASLAPLENRISGNAPVMIRYLRATLGYQSDLYYIGPFGGAWPPPDRFRGDWMSVRWNWQRPGPEAPLLDAMAANPELRVLHASGLYDLVTPAGIPAYQIAQLAPELRARFAVRVYEGGHSFYLDRSSRLRFKDDGVALIRGALAARIRR